MLYTPGNLTFTASDIYPASGEIFIIDASGSQATTITFQRNGSSQVPLSAGGTLLIDATNIVQAGTLRAPSGTIVLGVGDATDSATLTQFNNLPLINTQSVTLASGSVTSVSLDNTTVPFGTTTDGLDLQFNPVAGTANPDLYCATSEGHHHQRIECRVGQRRDGRSLRRRRSASHRMGTRYRRLA